MAIAARRRSTQAASPTKSKPSSTPGLKLSAKDLAKGKSDAGYGMEQHKQVIELKKEVRDLKKQLTIERKKR